MQTAKVQISQRSLAAVTIVSPLKTFVFIANSAEPEAAF